VPRCGRIVDAISSEIPSTLLKIRPFHPLYVNELSDADMNARKDACRAPFAAFCSQHDRVAVLFTDECAIYRSVHSRNIAFWSKENPHFYEELERNPPQIMVWARLSATHILSLSSFTAPLLDRLTTTCLANIWYHNFNRRASKTLLSCNWMEHHHTLPCTCVDYLNETFPGRWIGGDSEASPAPLAWPPRSPYLTTPDNALWGFIKERVSKMRYRTIEVLRAAVEEAFTHLTPDYLGITSARS
jgi:hypothetical protein